MEFIITVLGEFSKVNDRCVRDLGSVPTIQALVILRRLGVALALQDRLCLSISAPEDAKHDVP
jgi:hypothetical protein